VTDQPSPPPRRSEYRPSLSHLRDAAFEGKGWRSFFAYRDLGVKESTGGDFDVRIVRAKEGNHQSTGWHYHDLDIQVVYCVGGWELIALEDGRVAKLVPGSCLHIPPGYVHNEIAYGPDMEMFVLSGPAGAPSVPVPDPPGWDEAAVAARLGAETTPQGLEADWDWRVPAASR
jgi:quercetin dioxygenase-like cupin family protein